MNVIKTAIDGVVIIEPRIFEDSRGYFMESYCHRCGKSQSPATDKDKRGNPVYQIDIKHPFCKECWEIEKQ